MASIREYFDTDFQYVVTASRVVRIGAASNGEEVEVAVQVHLDFDVPAKYLSIFVPRHQRWFELCQYLVTNCYFLMTLTGDVNVKLPPAQYVHGGLKVANSKDAPKEITAHPLCEPDILDKELQFLGTVFIYTDNEAAKEDIQRLREFARSNLVRLRWRGLEFARELSLIQTPVAFISHDSRDKEGIARPLAICLKQKVCPVWFDDFSLQVGDSLRCKIEKGIKECVRCILILSPHFLANKGWTKTEFDSIFTREVLQQENLVLPVWCGITRKQLYEYSPTLADRVGLDWGLGIEEVCRRLYNTITNATLLPTRANWHRE